MNPPLYAIAVRLVAPGGAISAGPSVARYGVARRGGCNGAARIGLVVGSDGAEWNYATRLTHVKHFLLTLPNSNPSTGYPQVTRRVSSQVVHTPPSTFLLSRLKRSGTMRAFKNQFYHRTQHLNHRHRNNSPKTPKITMQTTGDLQPYIAISRQMPLNFPRFDFLGHPAPNWPENNLRS